MLAERGIPVCRVSRRGALIVIYVMDQRSVKAISYIQLPLVYLRRWQQHSPYRMSCQECFGTPRPASGCLSSVAIGRRPDGDSGLRLKPYHCPPASRSNERAHAGGCRPFDSRDRYSSILPHEDSLLGSAAARSTSAWYEEGGLACQSAWPKDWLLAKAKRRPLLSPGSSRSAVEQ